MTFVDSVYFKGVKEEFSIDGFMLVDYNETFYSKYRRVKINGCRYPIEVVWFKLYKDGCYFKINGECLLSYVTNKDKIYGFSLDRNYNYVGYMIPEYYRIVLENTEINVEVMTKFILHSMYINSFHFEGNNFVVPLDSYIHTDYYYQSVCGDFIKVEDNDVVKVVVPLNDNIKKLSGKLAKYRLLHNGVV